MGQTHSENRFSDKTAPFYLSLADRIKAHGSVLPPVKYYKKIKNRINI